ncbi:hypothetical protein OSB04_031498 [Centaurea solstitialis]|uniref:Uncharacterized protein n=1 Tax=Centaurea solstitialis TaxID=347529 RepID=A0AA38SM96_9ASTR|nr:hypothetical protein OSB04_031498 [Centaurea solstitialis]
MDLGTTGLKNLYSGNVIASCLPLKNIKTIKVYVRCEKLQTLFARNNSVGYKLPCLHTLHLEDLTMLKIIGEVLCHQ